MAIPGHDKTRLSRGELGPTRILFCDHKWEELDILGQWIYDRCSVCEDAVIKSRTTGLKFPVYSWLIRDTSVRLKDIEWMTRTQKEWKSFGELVNTDEGNMTMMLAVSIWT